MKAKSLDINVVGWLSLLSSLPSFNGTIAAAAVLVVVVVVPVCLFLSGNFFFLQTTIRHFHCRVNVFINVFVCVCVSECNGCMNADVTVLSMM